MTTNQKTLNILSTIKLIVSIIVLICSILGGISMAFISTYYVKSESFRDKCNTYAYEAVEKQPKLREAVEAAAAQRGISDTEDAVKYMFVGLLVYAVIIIVIVAINSIFNIVLGAFGKRAAKRGKLLTATFVMAIIATFFSLLTVSSGIPSIIRLIYNLAVTVFAYLVMNEYNKQRLIELDAQAARANAYIPPVQNTTQAEDAAAHSDADTQEKPHTAILAEDTTDII